MTDVTTTTGLVRRLWVHDAVNLADYVVVYGSSAGGGLETQATQEVYASGLVRTSSPPGVPEQHRYGLVDVDREAFQQLRRLVKSRRLLFLRDAFGVAARGLISAMSWTPWSVGQTVDVEITFLVGDVDPTAGVSA